MRRRGPDKKPRKAVVLVQVNLRLSPDTVEYYKQFGRPTVAMREVLTAYKERNEATNKTT